VRHSFLIAVPLVQLVLRFDPRVFLFDPQPTAKSGRCTKRRNLYAAPYSLCFCPALVPATPGSFFVGPLISQPAFAG
jgi:hypothetical protein